MSPIRQRRIYTEAMQFAIHDNEPAKFLRLWLEGDWDSLEREWPGYAIPLELRQGHQRGHQIINASSSGTLSSSEPLDKWLANQWGIIKDAGTFYAGTLWLYRASEQYLALDLIAGEQELSLTIAITGRLRLSESIRCDPFIEVFDAVDGYYLASLIAHELNIPLSYCFLSGPRSKERLLRSSTMSEKDSCLSLKIRWPNA